MKATLVQKIQDELASPNSMQTLVDLLAEALPLLQEPKWQPMETVPRDGRTVLVKVQERGGRSAGVHAGEFSQNVDIVGQRFSFDMPPATGWMPAPEIGDDT